MPNVDIIKNKNGNYIHIYQFHKKNFIDGPQHTLLGGR